MLCKLMEMIDYAERGVINQSTKQMAKYFLTGSLPKNKKMAKKIKKSVNFIITSNDKKALKALRRLNNLAIIDQEKFSESIEHSLLHNDVIYLSEQEIAKAIIDPRTYLPEELR